MARVNKVKCKADFGGNRKTPYPHPSCPRKCSRDCCCSKKQRVKALENNEWEVTKCSVCLEYPHNAVLLLCCSYNNGCRPYMCATSCRFSNCLEQYKRAYTKVVSDEGVHQSNRSAENSSLLPCAGLAREKIEVPELLCPLCRRQVKGWTVVEPARKYLNSKRRTCMQDNCSFVGTYRQLKKHVKAKHPLSRPRDVDPVLAAKWKKFEHEREQRDVISTILSANPGALVLGDYVIEPGYHDIFNNYDYDSDESMGDGFLPTHFHYGLDIDFDSGSSLDENDYGLHRHTVLGRAASSGHGSQAMRLGGRRTGRSRAAGIRRRRSELY